MSLKSFNPSSFHWKQYCPFGCCRGSTIDWSCSSNFSWKNWTRLVWAWRERERASICPLSNGNNIVPSVVIAVVAVFIEVATIFNMRFSREIWERFKWAWRASIYPCSNGNNVVSFVVVLIEVVAMFSMRFFDRIEQDNKLEERASIHPCSQRKQYCPFCCCWPID